MIGNPRPMRYAVATLAVALAIGPLFLPGLGQGMGGVLLFGVLIAAWYGGLGPGIWASLLVPAILVAFFRAAGVTIPTWQIWSFGIFVALGGLISVIFESLHAAQRRSEANRRWLSAVLTSIGDAVIATDRRGAVVFMNPVAQALTGWDPEEASGRPLPEVFRLLSEDTKEPVEDPVGRVLRDGAIVGLGNHALLIGRDGSEHPVADRAAPIRGASTDISGAVLVFRDVAEQKQAERRVALLAEAGRLLGSSLEEETILRSVHDLVVATFADRCALTIQDERGALRHLADTPGDSHEPKSCRDLSWQAPPAEADDLGLRQVLLGGEPVLLADSSELAPGQSRPRIAPAGGSVLILPINARGRTIGAMTLLNNRPSRPFEKEDLRVALDLASRIGLAIENARLFSEREQAARKREEALSLHRSVEEQLTVLVEASGSLSASLDPPSVLSAVLALSRRLIDSDAHAIWRQDTATGSWGIGHSSGLSEEYRESTIRRLRDVARMPEVPIVADDVMDVPLLGAREHAYRKEGICSLLAVPLRVRDRNSGTLVFYYRTPHRFTEVEVRVATALSNISAAAIGTSELYEELKDHDRRKDEFLAMLAHELRNPLAAVSNAVSVLRSPGDTEGRAWASEVIARQVRHLTRLIDDLLDVSRITRGKIRLRRGFVDASSILDQAVETVRPLMEERMHSLLISIERGRSRSGSIRPGSNRSSSTC